MTSTLRFTGDDARTLESQLAVAMLNEKHSDSDRAKVLYNDLLRRDPKHVESRRRLAIIAVKNDRFDEARKLFRECVELEPSNPELLNDYGYACYVGEDMNEAERHLLHAVRLRSNFQSAWTNLGLVYAAKGDFSRCREAFSKATDIPAEVHCNMAFMYAQEMMLELAKEEFSKALALDSENVAAAEGLVQVCKQIPGSEPKTVLSTFATSEKSREHKSGEVEATPGPSFQLQPPNSGTVSTDRVGSTQSSIVPHASDNHELVPKAR